MQLGAHLGEVSEAALGIGEARVEPAHGVDIAGLAALLLVLVGGDHAGALPGDVGDILGERHAVEAGRRDRDALLRVVLGADHHEDARVAPGLDVLLDDLWRVAHGDELGAKDVVAAHTFDEILDRSS